MGYNTKQEATLALTALQNCVPLYINWSEEGGGEVYRINWDWYILFRVPQYGGEPHFEGMFHKTDLPALVEEAFLGHRRTLWVKLKTC